MILKAVCLLAIGLRAKMGSSVAAAPCRGFGASVRKIERPTQPASILGLLGLVDQGFWDVWSSAVLLSFSFAA